MITEIILQKKKSSSGSMHYTCLVCVAHTLCRALLN